VNIIVTKYNYFGYTLGHYENNYIFIKNNWQKVLRYGPACIIFVVLNNKQKIKMEKKLLKKQRLFLSLVETMSLYKDSENKKDKIFYARTFVSATDIMLSLHEQGVKEETHPVFKTAMDQYRYWAKPINELI